MLIILSGLVMILNFKITKPLIFKDIERLNKQLVSLQEQNIYLRQNLSLVESFDYLNWQAQNLGLNFLVEKYIPPVTFVGQK